MNLLQALLDANGGQLVGQLARNFGLDEAQAGAALKQLVPAVAGGVRNNLGQAGGLEALLGALQRGQHARYVDQPDVLGQPDTVADGNAILGHLFGSKDVSRQVAARAAQGAGLDASLLKKMLPVVAAMAMGALNRQAAGNTMNSGAGEGGGTGGPGDLLGGLLGGGGARAGGGAGGLLGAMLDHDRDGSIVDDVLGMLLKR
jgi:hypothetical protein